MAGGTINGSTSNQYIDAKIVWSSVANKSDNTSTVTATLYYRRNNSGNVTHGIGTFTIKINAEPAVKSGSILIDEFEWIAAVTITRTVSHAADGTKAITISASGSIPGTTLKSTNVSGSVTLDTIRQPTTVDSTDGGGRYFDGVLAFKYTQHSVNVYNQLLIKLSIGNTYDEWPTIKTINLGKEPEPQRNSYELTLSEEELSKIYNYYPTADQGGIRYCIYTYADSGYTELVGKSNRGQAYLIRNDTTTQPTMKMTLSAVSDSSALSGLYVKGKSKVKATFTNGAGKYGASIVSYKLTIAGEDYSSPYTSDYLSTTGSITVKGTITDSRGFSRTYSKDITVLDYTEPTLDLLSCSSSDFTGTITHKYTPPNNTFYTRCAITLGSTTVKSETHTRASGQQTVSFSFEESELATIYKALPNSASGTLKFTFQAFTDSNYSKQIGSDSVKEITLSIPDIDDTQPTATFTVVPESSLEPPFNTLYIKGKTKVTATLASGAGKYGATIKSYNVTIGAQSGASPLTSAYLTTAGDLTITGTVTDSRGISRTYTQKITVIDHGAPRIIPVIGEDSVIVARCNENGALDSNGTGLLIAAKRSYSKVESNNVQNNYCALQFRWKVDGGSYGDWIDLLPRTDTTSDEIIKVALPVGTMLITSTYMVQVRAIDDLGAIGSTNIFVPTEKVYIHRAGSKNSLGIGKYAEEENVVDIAEDITAIFRGEVQFKSEEWVSRALGTNVVASTVNSGRWGGTGVFYRVCAGGKHIYVAFNVSFTTKTTSVRADSETIPAAYRPSYDVYALCPVGFSDGSRGIATVSVSPSGRVNIYAVHKLPGAVLSSGDTVNWIDGYIDYWT